MRRLLGASLGLGIQIVWLVSCGSSDGGGSRTSDSPGGSSPTAGSGNDSGSSASGGKSSGGQSSDGAGTSGAGGSSGQGGARAGCRAASDCPDRGSQLGYIGQPQCLAPGQMTPPICGAIGWCGQCACPPRQPDVGCTSDAQCSADAPHCLMPIGPGGCVQCRSTADCEHGVCALGECAPACGPEQPCADPFVSCSRQRCDGVVACEGNDGCPPNGACLTGICVRRSCETDAHCEGACVNGRCYDELGTCFQHRAVP